MEVPASFILLFVFLSFLMLGGYYKERLIGLFGSTFESRLNMEITLANVGILFKDLIIEGLMLLAPLFGIAIVVALLGNYVQFGFLLTGDPLKMKLSKINPVQGFKQIFFRCVQ